MNVQQKESEEKGRFYIESDEQLAAILDYSLPEKNVMVIEHTFVKPEFEGKGFGKALIEKAAEFARAHHLKIDPVCPYANTVMRRGNHYADILI